MKVPPPKQWEPRSAIPILAGIFWLTAAATGGWLFWALLPGSLMLATGVALLLWPGDLRVTHYMALGGLLGVVLAVPVLVTGGLSDGLLGAVVAAAAYVTAGRLALTREPTAPGVPPLEHSFALDAKTALDEALLAYFVGSAKVPSGEKAEQIEPQARELEKALTACGWLEHPEGMHPAPPAPDRVYVQQARIYGRSYERVSYPSGFTADPRLPASASWNALADNQQSVAWMLRHPGAPRPWLLCIHGYRMGEPWLDYTLFPPHWLHDRLGLNLLNVVLPLHGPRRAGVRSGDGYLDHDPYTVLYAQSQALWDLRRAVAWLRAQEDNPPIGVLGYSLGGCNAALLAQYERDLDFVIAGIPVVDLASATWRHIPSPHKEFYVSRGFTLEQYQRLLRPVSPLARPPLPSRERLYIFAGVADRVVLPDQPLSLAQHWGVPIQWYQGAHLTFRGEHPVHEHIEAAVQRAGWLGGPMPDPAR